MDSQGPHYILGEVGRASVQADFEDFFMNRQSSNGTLVRRPGLHRFAFLTRPFSDHVEPTTVVTVPSIRLSLMDGRLDGESRAAGPWP